VIVHGGAGKWPKARQPRGLKGVRKAAVIGAETIQHGGSAVDAVEAAVVSLEDDPMFNAGTGSTLNMLGEVEMDAAIVDGTSFQTGAVALVRGVRNPIRLARLVMEKTDHALIAGYGAERIASTFRLPTTDVLVANRVIAWKKALRKVERARKEPTRNSKLAKSVFPLELGDTVGALGMDGRGNIAAACSTGGVLLKLPGRIGDSAIIGSGLYADSRLGAATATGIGELAMRSVLSKATVDLMREFSAGEAGIMSVRKTIQNIGRGIGLLVLDKKGEFGAAHDTPHLCWASAIKGDSAAHIAGTHVKGPGLGKLLRG
jgi:beta-aspartyl-peptidase (threonine type)